MKLIRASRAARVLGVHVNTIRNWDRTGALKPDFVSPTGHRFYNPERLMKIAKAGRLTEAADKDDEARATA